MIEIQQIVFDALGVIGVLAFTLLLSVVIWLSIQSVQGKNPFQ